MIGSPTEAEWEHTCLGGTTTLLSFVENVTMDQVNGRHGGREETVPQAMSRGSGAGRGRDRDGLTRKQSQG